MQGFQTGLIGSVAVSALESIDGSIHGSQVNLSQSKDKRASPSYTLRVRYLWLSAGDSLGRAIRARLNPGPQNGLAFAFAGDSSDDLRAGRRTPKLALGYCLTFFNAASYFCIPFFPAETSGFTYVLITTSSELPRFW